MRLGIFKDWLNKVGQMFTRRGVDEELLEELEETLNTRYTLRQMQAYLVLEDGSVFAGESLGATGRATGELVFTTSMTGYQEILTDPSYAGQIVLMTYPLIGNYGVNDESDESRRAQAAGFVVREACETPSNWRARRAARLPRRAGSWRLAGWTPAP